MLFPRIAALVLLLGTILHAHPFFPGKLKELGVVAATKNSAGDEIRIFELESQHVPGPIRHDELHFYRFEFRSKGTLVFAETIPKDGDSNKITFEWSDESKCEITLLDGWARMYFSRDEFEHWKFLRRID